jgi:hypothetical protein
MRHIKTIAQKDSPKENTFAMDGGTDRGGVDTRRGCNVRSYAAPQSGIGSRDKMDRSNRSAIVLMADDDSEDRVLARDAMRECRPSIDFRAVVDGA